MWYRPAAAVAAAVAGAWEVKSKKKTIVFVFFYFFFLVLHVRTGIVGAHAPPPFRWIFKYYLYQRVKRAHGYKNDNINGRRQTKKKKKRYSTATTIVIIFTLNSRFRIRVIIFRQFCPPPPTPQIDSFEIVTKTHGS